MTREGGGWELRYEGIKIKEGPVPKPRTSAWPQAQGLGCAWALGWTCPGGGCHGHISHLPLLGKGRGGGDYIHTNSVLFWAREGVRVTMARYPLPLLTKGRG